MPVMSECLIMARCIADSCRRTSLDIDALFAKGSTSPTRVKEENTEDVNGKQSGAMDAYGASSSKRSTTTGSNDRVIGNQDPIGDFTRVVSESSGNELMEKAVRLKLE